VTAAARTVAVTGAGGFLGRYVCTRLRERGYAVRAITSRGLVPRDGLDVVTLADLCDEGALEQALRGVEIVVHLAGVAHVLGSEREAGETFHRANVTSVGAVCTTAAAVGASHVVLMSSAGVVGDPGSEIVTAATPLRPTSAYSRSKLEGEQRAHEVLAGTGVRLRILRPPMVYGPGMRGNPHRLFALVERGVPLPVGGVRNRRSIVSVRNLVDAVECTMRSSAPTGDALYVSDAIAPSTPELVRAIGVALGRPARLMPIPHRALERLADGLDVTRAFLPRAVRSAGEDLRRLTGSFVVDDAVLRETFGYVPHQTLADGLAETAAWWRAGRPDVWS
jgi:nucleoside-diphosphate-sugar epimerase